MNVRCPECKTLFRLADDKVGAHGAKVRCGKCRHVFVANRAEGGGVSTSAPPSPGSTFSSPFGAAPPGSTLSLSTATLGLQSLPPPAAPQPFSAGPTGFPASVDGLARGEGLPDLPDWALPPRPQRPNESSNQSNELSFSYGSPERSDGAYAEAPSELPALGDGGFDAPSDFETPALPPADDEPIDAATAMGRRRGPELQAARTETSYGRGAEQADAESPGRSRPEGPADEPILQRDEPPGFAPTHDDALTFEDHTTVEAPPSWLGSHADGLDAAQARNPGARWGKPSAVFDDRSVRAPDTVAPAPSQPSPPLAPLPPPLDFDPPPSLGPSTLDPEALFGGEDVPSPPPSFLPPMLTSPPPSPAAARIAERREATPRREVDPARVRRATERPFASPVQGRRAVLRAGLMVVALAAVLAIFVLWRNDWRFEPVGMMMARAFGGAGAPRVRSQIPGLGVRKVRRDVFESANGQSMLAVSGEIENDGTDRLSSVSVLVRLLDREGNPIAEREQFAVGVFEPEVIHAFSDAAAVDAEYKKRRVRSIVSPNSRLEFQILFFPLPREVEGLRLRVLVEVTGAVTSRG